MHDPRQRDDGHFASAAADIDDHGAGRFGNRKPRADRGSHGFFHQKGLACARRAARILDGALLHLGDSARDGDHHARPEVFGFDSAGRDLFDEILEHRLRDVKIGDHARFHRTDGDDVGRRAAQHPLGLHAHRKDMLGSFLNGDNRWLTQDNSLVLHVHERVRRSEIDTDIGREKTF